MRLLTYLFLASTLALTASAATKPHAITFGKTISVAWFVGDDEKTSVELKVHQMFIDARPREFILGTPHEVTDRLLVVRRVIRINDALPNEPVSPKSWRWERGGWLLVDRATGHTSSITLPEFDPYFSSASWYRDYVAYCGVSEDEKKISAIVIQVGRRKPLLRKPLGPLSDPAAPDSSCAMPSWQRQPARVTFDAGTNQRITFSVRAHALDISTDDGEEDAE
ncbi:MAG TPA: hypothetical protein VH437_12500 [Terriglobales bacterium]|jgi:hypothetical protein